MWRRPVLEVRSGRTDTNILPGLTGLWLSVSVTLNEAEESY